jgi:hypothetical protein
MRIFRTATVEGFLIPVAQASRSTDRLWCRLQRSHVLESRDSQKATSNIINELYSFSSYMHRSCSVIVDYSGAFISRSTSSAPVPIRLTKATTS